MKKLLYIFLIFSILIVFAFIFACSKATIKNKGSEVVVETEESTNEIPDEILDTDLNQIDFVIGEDIPTESVEQINSNDAENVKNHTIQTGETLYEISKRYGLNIWQIAKYNNVENPNLIFAGNKLKIPPKSYNPNINSTGKHYIDFGDTLFKISQKYGIDLEKLIDLNNISNPDYIQAGTVLILP